MKIKYAHTNLIAKDWKRLAKFYQTVFNCQPIPPERDMAGDWLDDITGIPQSHICGTHMLLPGFGDNGPTLEIFQYDSITDHPEVNANTSGFSHIAFTVEDVAKIADEVFAQGGSAAGKLVVRKVENVGILTVQYVRDPEGNIVELLNWEK